MVHWPHRMLLLNPTPGKTTCTHIIFYLDMSKVQFKKLVYAYIACNSKPYDLIMFHSLPHLFTKQLIHSRAAGSLRSWTGWLWWWRCPSRARWPFRLSTISSQHPSPPGVLVICTKAVMSLLQEEDWLHPQQFTNHNKVFIDHLMKQSI